MGQSCSRFYEDVLFDGSMDRFETKQMSEMRHKLLSDIPPQDENGLPSVLEIGTGSGLNLPHYPPAVRSITSLTTAPYPSPRSKKRAADLRIKMEHVQGDGMSLPFPDAHFDVVVATLIQCSVPEREPFIAEIYRVLKPGGRYLFMDHAWSDGQRQSVASRVLAPIHKQVALGCQLGRVWSLDMFHQAGFCITPEDVQHVLPGHFTWMVGCVHYGVAIKSE